MMQIGSVVAGGGDKKAPKVRDYKILLNTDYTGYEIKFADVPFRDCARECDLTRECRGYTMNFEENQGCWLKYDLKKEEKQESENHDTYIAL